jgi:NADPH-dependent glutamate synthase beta subunit-like oxidoreductase
MRNHECARLFEQYILKELVIKNRLVRSAMESAMSDPKGFVTKDHMNMYKKAAEGGVGLIITEAIGVHTEGRFVDTQLAAWHDEHIQGLKRLADLMHAHGDGVVVFAQLHCGGAKDWGYSYGQRDTGLGLDELTEETIHIIIEAFGDAARRVEEAGFDGIELHGGHGYMISQFLSSAVNHRKDKWGGTLTNRMRFPLEIYRAVRENVGANFPVGVKMNTADYLEGGNWVDDTSKIARKFAETGFDFIEATGGMGFMTELREALRKKVGAKEYYFSDAIPSFVEAVRGTNTGLAVVGGTGSPRVMEQILGKGVDFISLARPWLTEPDFANRVKAGDLRRTRCVSREQLCNLCLTRIALGSVTCVKFYPGDCKMQCPIDQDVAAYCSLIAQGKFEEALAVIKRDNPLANILSRVCDHPCERICRGETGEPLAIRDLKRSVTDYGLKNGLMVKAERLVKGERGRVAIVGSGPAGLACGFYLAQGGYSPTIFEGLSIKGGMLVGGIPKYRLPEEIVRADIEYVESAGVHIKTGTALGEDFSIRDLFEQGYGAVFLAVGTVLGSTLDIEGSKLEGVMLGLDLLRDVNMGRPSQIGKRVLVIGGGNVAVDAAMTSLRLGAKDVHLACLESRSEMPAYQWEIDDAMEEGVILNECWGPRRIRGNKKVTGVDLIKCTSVIDEKGEFNPTFDGSEAKTVDVDTVVVAIGQTPDLAFLGTESKIKVGKGGTIEVNTETLETSISGVFAGGDVVTGSKSVVDAVAAGKTAAESIDRFLQGSSLRRTPEGESYSPFIKISRPSAFADPSERILRDNSLRQVPRRLSVGERKGTFKEIGGALGEEQAINEAMRCLKYDLELEEKSANRMTRMGKATFVLSP